MRNNENMVKISSEFIKRYQKKPSLFIRSPGRVNIIGEHVDYHDGFVMPAAINLGINWALARNNLNKIRGFSLNTNEKDFFSLNNSKKVKTQWLQYLQGVIAVLKKRNVKISGVDLIIYGDLPIGSGLSSSSSLAAGFAFALSELFKLNLSRADLTNIGCEAEWWYGTTGGNMDQFVISHGKRGQAVFFDTREFKYEYVPIPPQTSIVIFETTIRHNQKHSPYTLRRQQSEKGLKIIQKKFKNQNIKKLRDVSLDQLESLKNNIDDLIFRRCYHVITENARVLAFKKALKNNNLKDIQKNLDHSHYSLRDNYEVSCKELNIAKESAHKIDGYIGSRMTGGGFGGCTVNLVKENKDKEFARELIKIFIKKTNINPRVYMCRPEDGVKIL